MINRINMPEFIKPLSDVIIPVKSGTKQIIKGLVKNNDAKTVETYLNLDSNISIQAKEVLFADGKKASFSERKTPAGIFRVWEHGGDSKVSTLYNNDGDLLSFKAKGYSTDMSGDEPTINHWVMRNDAYPQRKILEIDRTKNIFKGLLNNFFNF